MFNRIGSRYIASTITSFILVVIYIWFRHNYMWICLYILLRIGEWEYEHCSKKSSKMLKRNSETSFWNKGLNTYFVLNKKHIGYLCVFIYTIIKLL